MGQSKGGNDLWDFWRSFRFIAQETLHHEGLSVGQSAKNYFVLQ